MSDLRFGEFELDHGQRLLFREGSPVHLSPKAFKLLEILIEGRPNALSKQELHDTIWPGTFVSEATLASLIAELREALRDHARSPRFIRTVYAFGYSFCGEASETREESIAREPVSAHGFVECNGQQTALSEGENVIGRDPDVAVFIDDVTVSRHHARLTIAGERAMLEDLGSKNGTFVQGRQIQAADLENGSEFHVGGVKLTFRRSLLGVSTMTLDRSRTE
jgi:DNA-binding winged helix-turn-helix (wHTH) protein